MIKIAITLLMSLSSALTMAEYKSVEDFGKNPGNLEMLTYTPSTAQENSPIIVLLHGCLQTAQDFSQQTGWETLANERGYKLLLPQTNKSNNQYNCFNWFERSDSSRNRGEILSIVNMINAFKQGNNDVYVTGLSAGGAMASNLIATHPEEFKAASFSAGVPFACAKDALTGILCMNAGRWSNSYGVEIPTLWEQLGYYQLEELALLTLPGMNPLNKTAEKWGKLVKAASRYEGIYPRVSIWHGVDDDIVSLQNATALFKQWTNVHGSKIENAKVTMIENTKQSQILSRTGEVVVELNQVNEMGHGWAIDETCGTQAPYILNAGICSTLRIANFFMNE